MNKIPFKMSLIKKYKTELALAVIGIALMLISASLNNKKEVSPSEILNNGNINNSALSSSINSYAEVEAERLKEFLEDIKGVGSVDAIIYVSSTTKTVNASEYNNVSENTEENDSNGGKRVNTRLDENVSYKIIKDSKGDEKPIYVCDEYPEIKGVIISAEGAGSNTVKETIIDAVSRLYDIPVHKISVVEKTV